MSDARTLLNDFDVPSKKITVKQLTRELKEIVGDLLEGSDFFQNRTELFTESDPVAWGEAVLHDRKGNPQRYWPHQIKFLRSKAKRKAARSGRDTGKTTVLVTRSMHKAFTQPNKNILIGTPKRSHYAKIIGAIRKQLKFNPSLASRVTWATDEADNIELQFWNGSVIYFRQGFPDGEAFRGLDADLILVDEAAFMVEPGWKGIDGCLRSDGDQEIEIFSNPDGRRTTTFYRRTDGKSDTSFELHAWPRWLNPGWTEKQKAELIETHGGENSPGYTHEVKGEHGAPSFAAFQEDRILAALKPIEDYAIITINGDYFADLQASSEAVEDKVFARINEILDKHLLPFRERSLSFFLGGDLGQTGDPTELFVESQNIDGTLVPYVRVHCEHLPYPIQAALIAALDRRLHFIRLTIDRGNNGLSVYQMLTGLDFFKPYRFSERLRAVDFNASLLVGYDRDPEGDIDYDKPIRKFAKVFSTDLISKALLDQKKILPDSDNDLEDQFIGHQFEVSPSGRITYTKGNDHIVDAVRFLILGIWLYAEAPEEEGAAREEEAPMVFGSGRGL